MIALAAIVVALALGTDLPPGHPKIDADLVDGGIGQSLTQDNLLQKLDSMKDLAAKDKSFDIAAAIGRVYYSNGRYTDAARYLEQAVAKGEPAQRLFLQQRQRLGKSPDGSQCSGQDNRSVEALIEESQSLARARNARAGACAKAALDRVVEAERLLANAYFLSDRPDKAVAQLDQILRVSDKDSEATFARAAILYDSQGDNVAMLSEAKKGFEKFLTQAPEDSRAAYAKQLASRIPEVIAAGGVTAYDRKRGQARATPPQMSAVLPGAAASAPALSRDVMEAIQNTERTPELEKGLQQQVDEGEEHLARGRYEDALIAYRNVMPYQPQNGRVQAGMAWALYGLNKPTAARVWSVAVNTDSSAVERLGDTLKSKGDVKGAKALWTKLAEANPDYASKSDLAKKLR